MCRVSKRGPRTFLLEGDRFSVPHLHASGHRYSRIALAHFWLPIINSLKPVVVVVVVVVAVVVVVVVGGGAGGGGGGGAAAAAAAAVVAAVVVLGGD